MTIDEAIAQEREMAEKNRQAMNFKSEDNIDDDIKVNFLNCATKHEQFAEWLEELKFLRQWKSDVMEEFCKYDVSSFEELVINARNKAINDFIHACDKECGYYKGENKNLTRECMLMIAKKLKAGEKD